MALAHRLYPGNPSAFGALAFSSTPVLHAIGLTVGLGAAFSLLVAAMLGRQQVIA